MFERRQQPSSPTPALALGPHDTSTWLTPPDQDAGEGLLQPRLPPNVGMDLGEAHLAADSLVAHVQAQAAAAETAATTAVCAIAAQNSRPPTRSGLAEAVAAVGAALALAAAAIPPSAPNAAPPIAAAPWTADGSLVVGPVDMLQLHVLPEESEVPICLEPSMAWLAAAGEEEEADTPTALAALGSPIATLDSPTAHNALGSLNLAPDSPIRGRPSPQVSTTDPTPAVLKQSPHQEPAKALQQVEPAVALPAGVGTEARDLQLINALLEELVTELPEYLGQVRVKLGRKRLAISPSLACIIYLKLPGSA